jgi:hypothetical protein
VVGNYLLHIPEDLNVENYDSLGMWYNSNDGIAARPLVLIHNTANREEI